MTQVQGVNGYLVRWNRQQAGNDYPRGSCAWIKMKIASAFSVTLRLRTSALNPTFSNLLPNKLPQTPVFAFFGNLFGPLSRILAYRSPNARPTSAIRTSAQPPELIATRFFDVEIYWFPYSHRAINHHAQTSIPTTH